MVLSLDGSSRLLIEVQCGVQGEADLWCACAL